MALKLSKHVLLLLLPLVGIPAHKTVIAESVYIVHLQEPDEGFLDSADRKTWHLSFLRDESSLIYSYKNSITGFAAKLSEEEVEEMKNSDGFLQAYPDAIVQLQTTYSSRFLGLDPQKNDGLWQTSKMGEGIIIGILDGGIWPESPSFHDQGIPSPPQRWKGICQNGTDFGPSNCNNKIIGARYYDKDNIASPTEYANSSRDSDGHGTHTSSIAAGNSVSNASFLGIANGTARGMAPLAHVAMYKVCWETGCTYSGILAGLDDAMAENLNYPSFSVVFNNTDKFLASFQRTVTNVGDPTSNYSAQVVEPNGMKVSVNPNQLSFTAVNEKKSYIVTFDSILTPLPSINVYAEGSLSWVSDDEKHKVRSPISVTWA